LVFCNIFAYFEYQQLFMGSVKSSIFGFFLLAALALSLQGYGQCTGGTFVANITPTTTFQTIACVNAGRYYTFAAVAGATYTFSYGQGGGSGAAYDTYLTILDNSGTPVAGAFDNNGIFPNLANLVWIAPATATYRILTTLPTPGCGSNALCATMAYRMINPPGAGSSCGNPTLIASIPYTNTGLTTCGNGNTYTSANSACANTYMNGEDYIFRYSSPGNECINISLSGTTNWVGLFVYNGCPNVVGTTCVAQATSGSGNPSLSNVLLATPGTYYFMVSTLPPPTCTAFNISISSCPTGTTCSYARPVPSLPYSQTGLTTCGFGNDYTSANACGSSYMNGEDFIFSYTVAGPRCIDIFTTNTSSWAGLFIYNGCPSTVGTTCIAQNTSIYGNPTLTGTLLPAAGTYYFMVDTKPLPNCTPFDILIDTCRPPVPCGANPPSTNGCVGATNISSYTTFCGTTDTTIYTPDGPGNLTGTFCGTIENNSWWSFVADTSVIHFFFTVYNCYHGNGIQAQVLSTNNCTNFTSVSTCFNPTTMSNGTLTASGLVPGQTYYLMVDGYAHDDCDYTVTWDGGPLPVNFGNVSAIVVDGAAHLNWETLQETNCERFVVERGSPDLDGEVNGFAWEPAGTLQGNGTTTARHDYFFVDDAPLVVDGYYRIREVDYNGFSTYSEILHVTEALAARNELLEIYPNPAKDRLHLTLGFAAETQASFRLFDASGKVVQAIDLGNFQIGTSVRSIDLPALSNGVYFYEVRMGQQSSRGKLVIVQ
jgi:Secretion system C-terminal sorting domain